MTINGKSLKDCSIKELINGASREREKALEYQNGTFLYEYHYNRFKMIEKDLLELKEDYVKPKGLNS